MTETTPQGSSESRRFHLGDLLSVTTGVLVSPRYMEGLSDVVAYLTGADIDVDRIPESLAACRAYILLELPAFRGIAAEDVDFDSWRSWLDSQKDRLGEWHLLPRPAPGEIRI
jgi:hypothetical protein